jgi:thiol-disulfide isomerase/thioredoxin
MTRRELFPLALAPLASSLIVPAAFGQTVPRPADELLINTMTGSKISLKAMKGKVVAVELLLTWCSHCQASARVLQDLYTELKPKGLEVVGAATNTEAAKAKEDIGGFMGVTGAKFPIGWIPNDQSYAFLQHPMTKGLQFPQLVLIDRKGNVVFQHMGEIDAAALRPEIMKALGAAAPVAARRTKKA